MSRTWGIKQHAAGCEPTALNHEEHKGDSNSRAVGPRAKGVDPLSAAAVQVCADVANHWKTEPPTYETMALLIVFAPFTEFIDTPEAKHARYVARICEGALELRRPNRHQRAAAFVHRCELRREAAEALAT